MNLQSKGVKFELSIWSTVGIGALALLGAGLYYGLKNKSNDSPDQSDDELPYQFYIIDLENIHCHSKDLSEKDAVYLGFIGSRHYDLEKYSDWTRCTTTDFGAAFSKSHQKLLYVVDDREEKTVDNKITELIPEFIKYIEKYCSPDLTINLVSENKSMRKTESKLEKHFIDNEMYSVTVERIRDNPFRPIFWIQ